MLTPTILFFIVFCYIPMPGAYIAFVNYNMNKGIFASPFVGMKNFEFLIKNGALWNITKNTLLYNLVFLTLENLVEIIFAVMLSEVANKWFKKISQSVILLPYFISMAETVPPLARGVMLVPYLTGTEANSRVRGAFTGLGLETTRECCIRAVMEAMGYTLREKLEEMQMENEQIISLGGASRSNIWNQIKADICGKKIAVLEAEESTSLGAAILGALAVGDLCSMETAAVRMKTKKSYTPITENTELYEAEYEKFRNICGLIASAYE